MLMFSPIFCTSAWRLASTFPGVVSMEGSSSTFAGLRVATSSASEAAKATKSSFFATKSVSLLSSTSAPDADVLADLLHERLAPRLHLSGGGVDGGELLYVRRVARRHELGERSGKGDEILVLRHEVGLAVELDERAHLAVGREPGADYALRRDAAGGLARLGAALDAEQLLGFLEVARAQI